MGVCVRFHPSACLDSVFQVAFIEEVTLPETLFGRVIKNVLAADAQGCLCVLSAVPLVRVSVINLTKMPSLRFHQCFISQCQGVVLTLDLFLEDCFGFLKSLRIPYEFKLTSSISVRNTVISILMGIAFEYVNHPKGAN